ncbi:MAG: CoA transferase [Gammaproteobacteria bacterium]|nr:CoA transferase [Gammaproteobacteria bacterium]MBT3867618.1 CoA transferase [Gammaproteobacteria bacterium]MBT4616043.1 CoA transferase [Gammaproteobacteria bacterium]MBT5196199.1 CoA transferase [Gammaproteobacteria bacterium]MBT5441177.1 CoA transferase [Gammaproteobacteria bacterium]
MSDYLFSGLKVLDCATVIAAPAAAMMLADYGADVIKIEQPGEGDMLRMLGDIPTTPYADSDWFWQLDGRNKRGVALDLKQTAGMEILRKLVAGCDVFITNQPYSVRESLGITYEDLKPLNPGMIYASLTAYGEKGPERQRKGFDQLAYWARSGLMELMREPGTMPTQGLPGMGDHPTGVALYAGIVTALLNRERSGEGSMVETSLLANGLWSAAGIAQGVMADGDMPLYRSLNESPPAMMRPYETLDGRWLQFNMIRNEDLQSLLFVAMGAPEILADARFSSQELMFENRELLGRELQKIIKQNVAKHWLKIFDSYELPVNLVALVEESKNDPQVLQNQMVVAPEDDRIKTPLIIEHPIQISNVPKVGPICAPALGEHTGEVLADLGYSVAEVTRLRESGVI